MPSTVNGIGTHYYGKTNLTVRTAQCRSCQRVGNLESYDTRLWFVVVFIPIIPLGRKRIIDKCPACTRHYVMNADTYEQTKQLQTSGSLEKFRREPSPDAAIEAHGQLLGFHEHRQAADFRQAALARFPDHAGLRAGMAAQLRQMSSFDESANLFQAAFDLDPDLPEARVGVANRKMAEGDLDGAQILLRFLEEPGAGRQYSLVPIDLLSIHLQHAGRHEEALRLAQVLMRELPEIEDIHKFRTFVKKSEKALGRTESILPGRGFSLSKLFRSEGSHYAPWQRKLAIGTVAAVLLVGGLAVNNEYIRRHRTLHVLNATGRAARVQVDGGPAVTVSGIGRLTVSEGPHVIRASGPVDETHNLGLESGYLDRWFSNPAWVLNLGGEAVLEDITHVYSASGTPGQRRLLVGTSTFHRPHVDYVFAPAPGQISVKNKNEEIIKTEIGWAQAEDFNAFMETIDADHKAAMDFAEKRLRRNPKQDELLKYYMARSNQDERGRVEGFLRSQIDRRPVDVRWHRAFQTIAELNNHTAELVPRYDGYLAADPTNASLLYLRGRIDPDWDEQEAFYRRAIVADPKLAWPWMALAARACSAGKWDECLAASLKARELDVPEKDLIAELLHDARMAKGDAKALVDEYRAAVASAGLQDIPKVLFLIDSLSASDQGGEIEPAIGAWVARLPGPVQGQVAPLLRAMGLYYAGKLEECAEFCNADSRLKSSPSHLHALLALGRAKDVTDDPAFEAQRNDPLNLLAISVGLGLAAEPEDSARWRGKAVDLLKKVGGATDVAKAAELLGAAVPPSVGEVQHVYLPPENKAVLYAALADQFPDRREAFLAEAGRLNVSRKPSYYLIRRVLEEKAPGKP